MEKKFSGPILDFLMIKTCLVEGEKSAEVCRNSRYVEDKELDP